MRCGPSHVLSCEGQGGGAGGLSSSLGKEKTSFAKLYTHPLPKPPPQPHFLKVCLRKKGVGQFNSVHGKFL